jgi:hypothetical protein
MTWNQVVFDALGSIRPDLSQQTKEKLCLQALGGGDEEVSKEYTTKCVEVSFRDPGDQKS